MFTQSVYQDYHRIQTEVEVSLPERFEGAVERHSFRPAFGAGAWQPTYQDLNIAANCLAHGLLDRGGRPGDRVALLMEHDARAVAAMLAVLKASRVIVTLNRVDPPVRLRQILEDSQATLILHDAANQELAAELAPFAGNRMRFEDYRADKRVHNPGIPISHAEIAFLAYTSGSTGRPKGVIQTHSYLLDHIRRYSPLMQFVAVDRVLLLSSLAGLLGVSTAWCALLNGAALCPFPVMLKGVTGLADWMNDQRITVYISSTSLFRHFMRTLEEDVTFPAVRVVRLTSELADREDFRAYCRHFADHCAFVHGLSSTEGGNVANLRLTRSDTISGARLPAGRVADGVEVALVDEQGREVARGQAGEIVVRGRHLAAGYWRDDALTAAKFSDWMEGNSFRTFRSGDLGRFNADGLLEFVGRKDGRIKIRGYRVELSEVEEALLQLPDIENAVACVVDRPERGAQLVAYIIPRPGRACTPANLRRMLHVILPDYMIPSIFVMVDRFPLTPQAKIDRGVLLNIHPPLHVHGQTDQTKTEIESLLCEIWEEAFNIAWVGPRDNFFELGGDSLIAAVIAAGVHASTGVELNLGKFADHPTVAELARVIDEMRDAPIERTRPPLVRVLRDGALPLSHNQERIWNFCRAPEVAAKYTMSRRHVIEGPLDVGVFHECIGYMFNRHETLRTTFPERNGGPAQVIRAQGLAPLTFVDLSGTANAEEQATLFFDQEATQALDLAQGPLLRFLLVRIRENLHWLMHVTHHIITDAWSWSVFLHELGILYESRLLGEAPPLPESEPLQYCDFAAWQRSALSDRAAYQKTIEWWKHMFAEPAQALEFRFKRTTPRLGLAPAEGAIGWGSDQEVSWRLGELGREEGATYFVVRLAAFVALLAAETRNPDVVIGSHVSSRNRLELQKMLGDFSDLATFRYRLDPDRSFRDWLSIVRKRFLDTEAHCELPYEHLRAEVRREGISLPEPRVIFQKRERESPALFGGLRMTRIMPSRPVMPWGFSMTVADRDNDEQFLATFDAGIYDPAGVRELNERYRRLLDAASRAPDTPVGELLKMSENRSATGWLRNLVFRARV